jgi:hypothetical protein
MVLSNENNKILKRITEGKTIKEKYYGIQAMDKVKKLFFPNNKKEADKWASRWTNNEKKTLFMLHILLKKINAQNL